jgi:hypothetical protein
MNASNSSRKSSRIIKIIKSNSGNSSSITFTGQATGAKEGTKHLFKKLIGGVNLPKEQADVRFFKHRVRNV